MKQIVDIDHWARKELYCLFSKSKNPYYQVSANVEVTQLLEYAHSKGYSFYLTMIHEVMAVVNTIENFRYRLENGEVVLYDEVHPSFTNLRKGEEIFKITNCRCRASLSEFIDTATQLMSQQQTFFGGDQSIEPAQQVYISCLPWIETTCITNEHSGDANESVVLINWGKYVNKDGRYQLNITLDVNHRFIDGYHIGLFFTRLQERLYAL